MNFRPLKGLGAYPKKNILTPLLWLSGITFPSGMAAFCFAPWPQGLLVFLVACLPVIFTVYYYRHWANNDPDRLQTEDFRIRVEAVARLGDKSREITLTNEPGRLTANTATETHGSATE